LLQDRLSFRLDFRPVVEPEQRLGLLTLNFQVRVKAVIDLSGQHFLFVGSQGQFLSLTQVIDPQITPSASVELPPSYHAPRPGGNHRPFPIRSQHLVSQKVCASHAFSSA